MKTRVISALIMIAIVLPLLFVGGNLFAFGVAIIACFGFKELMGLVKSQKDVPILTEIISYLSILYLILNHYNSDILEFVVDYRILVVILFIFLAPTVFVSDNKRYSFYDGLSFIGSTLFIGFSFRLFILMRNYSLDAFLYLILITTMTDTFALVTGKYVGSHKLCPKISPKKTVEGLVGGTIMGTVISMMFYLTVINANVNFIHLLITTVSLSLIGQLGDLVFSQVKRCYDVKDFSNLIPGHGGILDRLDSLIFVVMMYTLFVAII